MIQHHSYQNPINERHLYKITIHYTCLSIVSRLVIFCWHVSHLLNFDIANMITFDTKYLSKKDGGEKDRRKKMGKIWPISKGKRKWEREITNEREIHAPQAHNMVKYSHPITSNNPETTATTYCQNQSSWIWFLPKPNPPDCFYSWYAG